MFSSFLSTVMRTAAPEPPARLPPTTITYLLQDHIIPIDTLYARHGSAAIIAKHLLGIVPNTGKYFEIWPPANKCYYMMVPSFLNLPAYLVGYGAPKELVSLAVYASSLAACCPYCSSHTATFSVRRGVPVQKLGVESLCKRHGEKSELYSPIEKCVIDVSELLATYPCKLTNAHRRQLLELTKDAGEAEAMVLGMAMMGYLNKGMDGLGMPLEVSTYRETRDVIGETWSPGASGQNIDPEIHTPEPPAPKDSVSMYMAVAAGAPSAINFERNALAVMPENADDATAFLVERYKYDCPVLKSMQHARAMRAVATMVHECLNPETSVIGMKAKILTAQIFATITESVVIQEATQALAMRFGIEANLLETAKAFASESDPLTAAKQLYPADEDQQLQAYMVVAHCASWSPARIDGPIITLCEEAELPPPSLVEVIAIISMFQMLHRISTFYRYDQEEL